MTDLWESKMDHPVMRGALNMAQLTLACALGLEVRNQDFAWRPQHPKLAAWYDRVAGRPSFNSTLPPRP
jgi:glutathione S-transferase